MLTQEQKSNDIVKSMLGMGMDETKVEDFINKGYIPSLAKSMTDAEMEAAKKKEEEEKARAEKDKKESGKDIEALRDDMKAHNEKMEKSFATFQQEFLSTMTSIMAPMAKSMAATNEVLTARATVTQPSFKGVDMNSAVIQKAMTFEKDSSGKTEMSVTTQRYAVRELIGQAMDNCQDENLKKSIENDAQMYVLDPTCTAVGENLARYLYSKHNVKLVP